MRFSPRVVDEQGFRARLRQAREKAGESSRSLSLKIGASHGTVGNIEEGRVADPGINLLKALADALNVSLDWLVSGESAPEKKPQPPATRAA